MSNVDGTFGYFLPLRPSYSKRILNSNYIHTRDNILGVYDIAGSYRHFDSCDVVITEAYLEQDANELIRTLIYPIYTNKSYKSMLMVDIRSSYFNDRLEQHLKWLKFLWSANGRALKSSSPSPAPTTL